MTMDVLGTFNN